MTPEEANKELLRELRPQYAKVDMRLHYAGIEALHVLARMDYQEADYQPPRYYTVDETTEKGGDLGDFPLRAKRLVGTWEEA